MKLSEAIRLSIGAVEETRMTWCGCAIGTALHSLGKKPRYFDEHYGFDGPVQQIIELWPWTAEKCGMDSSIAMAISNRHSRGESRESIAAWIESIEPQDAPTQVEHVAETVSRD
jgi:hypothetical protein